MEKVVRKIYEIIINNEEASFLSVQSLQAPPSAKFTSKEFAFYVDCHFTYPVESFLVA